MAKTIIFKSLASEYFDNEIRPYPAHQSLPQWWRSASKTTQCPVDKDTSKYSSTFKQCYPIRDSLMAGYIIPLTADILVTKENNAKDTTLSWRTSNALVELWDTNVSNGFEIPKGHNNQVFKLLANWSIQTPKGYSTLFLHPMSSPNTPFRSVAGIVDTDKLKTEINCPFTLDANFEGIIEAGTPMVQVIPFKRDDWKSNFIRGTTEEFKAHYNNLFSTYFNAYGRKMHTRKKYQ